MLKDTLKLGGAMGLLIASIHLSSCTAEWLWDNILEDKLDDLKDKLDDFKKNRKKKEIES